MQSNLAFVSPSLTPQAFIRKWAPSTLKERSGSQEHFIDLCRMVGVPTPAEVDKSGRFYCFERGAKKAQGGDGWADVWLRGHFAWEYKGKRKNLKDAYLQLLNYATALESPPLLVVSDMETIMIYTQFTNTVQAIHAIPLEEIGHPDNIRLLRAVFTDPDSLKPGITTQAITEDAASRLAGIALRLREQGHEAHRVAHFLNRMLFCMFAEDADLLPRALFTRLLESCVKRPSASEAMFRDLFKAMSKGGVFGADFIEWFNGGLFDSDDTIPLSEKDVADLLEISRMDWSAIEPSIFGTLFERGLDPDKRSQLGAHYTDAESIMRIVRPVVVDPLLAEWAQIATEIEATLRESWKAKSIRTRDNLATKAQRLQQGFLHRLATFKVLDPACGSGNFLYLALQALKDIEHRVVIEAETLGLPRGFVGMNVGVHNVRGIELSHYAAELARVTVWIGEIQWMLKHGVPPSKNPILKTLETIECADALVTPEGDEKQWPEADAIVGNPPFLGDKKMQSVLGKDYTQLLRSIYEGRLDGRSDLVTYWYLKGLEGIEAGRYTRVGLVATSSISRAAGQDVLKSITDRARIFHAYADEDWVNEGAAVRVSLVCFEAKNGTAPVTLDGQPAVEIYADLTGAGIDLTKAQRLRQNQNIAYQGIKRVGTFEVPAEIAREWLRKGGNPNGRPNSDVLRPWASGYDVLRRPQEHWIVDFGVNRTEAECAGYEAPYAYIKELVKPERVGKREKRANEEWWVYYWPRPEMRAAIARNASYIATVVVAKHRIFQSIDSRVVPDGALVVFARRDSEFLGILSSRFHVLWSERCGSTLEDRPRYTPTTSFETFPFPDGLTPDLSTETYDNPYRADVLIATGQLTYQREMWLFPNEWHELVPEVVPAGMTETPYAPRIVVKPEHALDAKARTLTALYNAQPTWLVKAHEELDAAVAHAYGWSDYTPAMPDSEILKRLLDLNAARAAR